MHVCTFKTGLGGQKDFLDTLQYLWLIHKARQIFLLLLFLPSLIAQIFSTDIPRSWHLDAMSCPHYQRCLLALWRNCSYVS